jgi:intracellular septation protein
MKQLLELVPIALFFIVYNMKGDTITIGTWEHQIDGILTATAVLMVATVIQVIITYILTRELEKRLIWLMLAVLGFGGLTLVYRDGAFIQWKPTIFNWGMAVVFAGSQFIGKKNVMERLLGSQIHLPRRLWSRLNLLWITNFIIVGGLNLLVAFNYSEETWVSYKLYSAIGFTLLLTLITAVIIAPHLKEDEEEKSLLPQDD